MSLFALPSAAPQPLAPRDVSERDAGTTEDSPRVARRGRPSMPSWDEIVFGARTEDDPA